MPKVDGTCKEVELFLGTELERAAYCAYRARRFASARTLAEKALEANRQSVRALFLMGAVQHQGEGNLPRALFLLEQAEKAFRVEYGSGRPAELTPRLLLDRILLEIAYVHGEMDHHPEKIRYVDALYTQGGTDYRVLKAWPLLKLKRFDEARQVTEEGLRQEDPWVRAVAATALCAIESELRHREAAYEACILAAKPVRNTRFDGSIELSNAGAASEEVFHFDEAEQYYLDATTRAPEGSVNPWGRLTNLYIRQGRLPEAVSAWRSMGKYRRLRPATYLAQQDQAEAELLGASLLLLSGHLQEAEVVTDRALARPDRQGTSSAIAEQNEGGAALMDRLAKLSLAHQLEAESAALPWFRRWGPRLRALGYRAQTWMSTRRALAVLSDPDRLISSMRPECPGSVELPAWLDGEVVRALGPGVALGAIEAARREETLPATVSEPIFRGLEAEAYLAKGESERALDAATEVLNALPSSEGLLRARAAAIAAEAAVQVGRISESLPFFETFLSIDPGLVMRRGMRVPVAIIAPDADGISTEAVRGLSRMRHLLPATDGLPLEVRADGLRIRDRQGRVLRTAMLDAIDPQAQTVSDPSELIARLAARNLFATSLGLTPQELKTLNGGFQRGERAQERVKSWWDQVQAPSAR
jgi:tetratricopeptide (TPR) repeat protein